MAEAAYWTGRYLERAEDMARVIAVHSETHFDLPVGEDVGWGPLLMIAGLQGTFDGPMESGLHVHGAVSASQESRIVRFLLTDRDNPSSILASLDAARSNLRTARSVVPREVWEVCNDLWLTLVRKPAGESPARSNMPETPIGQERDDRIWALRKVIAGCEHLNGVVWGTMQRDEALTFVRLGQQLERVDLTSRVLGVRAESLICSDKGATDDPCVEVRRTAVLRSLAAYQPFRRSTWTSMPTPWVAAGRGPNRRSEGLSMVHFVLHDGHFPRSVASCIGEALELAKSLPRNEQTVAAVNDSSMLLGEHAGRNMTSGELSAFSRELQAAVAAVHENILATYFPAGMSNSLHDPGSKADQANQGDCDEPTRTRIGVESTPRARVGDTIGPEMGKRIYRVRHTTTYEYEAPVEQSYNEAHLRPRDTEFQRCLHHALEVVPSVSAWSEHVDLYGNVVASFVVGGGFRVMRVTATSDVEVSTPATRKMTSGPPWETARMLVDADRLPQSRDARPFRMPSRLIPTSSKLAEYTAVSFIPGRPIVSATLDLCGRIHRDFAYDPGFTSVTTPLMEVFEHRRGVCQDFAHLAVGCLRSTGLAARYVSGYLETLPPPEAERRLGADASHAWASVFLPGWGWFDIDPTNNQVADDTYVTVAWGRDYQDVSPLRGSVEGGGSSHTLDVEVNVSRLNVQTAQS
ncbi:MAG TPA: alpha-E domain-containing protein [Acidimicrobiales bacterium]|nr:alpha-E domain-containing protein [Acidimicrobiales bacterium]